MEIVIAFFVIVIVCMMLGAGGQVNENAKQGRKLDSQIPNNNAGCGWALLSIISTVILVIVLFSLASLSMFGK